MFSQSMALLLEPKVLQQKSAFTKKLQQNGSCQISKPLTHVEPLHQTKVKNFSNDREPDKEEQYSLQLYW